MSRCDLGTVRYPNSSRDSVYVCLVLYSPLVLFIPDILHHALSHLLHVSIQI